MKEVKLLIVGGDSDPNTRRVADQAHIRDTDYLFWDSDLSESSQIAWDFTSPTIDLGSESINPAAIYLRYNVFGGDANRNQACFDAVQSYALAWPHVRILNRSTMTDANNKSKNLRLAINAGFTIPKTTVLGDLTPLARIPDPGNTALKPLNGGAHTQLASDLLTNGAALDQLEPQFIQECLRGENLRVFVIDNALYCFHLQTGALDYREDPQVEVIQVDVPESLVQPTKRLVSAIGFDYCALDFRCRSGFEDPVFLEVNSFPMFVRFDDAGKNCLVDRILDFFLRS